MENKKNKLNKTLKSLLVILPLATGIAISGAFIGKDIVERKNSAIIFHSKNKNYKLDKQQIHFLEELTWFQHENKLNKSYYETEVDTGAGSTKKQVFANYITNDFLRFSLAGISDPNFSPSNFENEQKEGFILTPKEDDNWGKTNLISKGLEYKDIVEILILEDIYKSTEESNVSVLSYLTEKSKSDKIFFDSASKLIFWLMAEDRQQYDFWQVFENFLGENSSLSFDEYIKPILDFFKSDFEYIIKINQKIYSYSYLWQKTKNTKYDYFVTKYIHEKIPFFSWAVSLDSSLIESNSERGSDFKEEITENYYGETVFSKLDEQFKDQNQKSDFIANWNTIQENGTGDNKQVTLDGKNYLPRNINKNNRKLTLNGIQGFEGVKFAESNSSNISNVDINFSDPFANNWYFENLGSESEPNFVLMQKENLLNFYKDFDGNYIIQEEATSSKNLKEDPEDPTDPTEPPEGAERKVYLKENIYPFIFPTEFDENNNVAKKWIYSFEAYQDGEGHYYNQQNEDESFTKQNILDVYFKDIDVNADSIVDEKDKNILELYFFDSVIGENISIEDTYLYWNQKGFNIELKGKYFNEYKSFFPEQIIKK